MLRLHNPTSGSQSINLPARHVSLEDQQISNGIEWHWQPREHNRNTVHSNRPQPFEAQIQAQDLVTPGAPKTIPRSSRFIPGASQTRREVVQSPKVGKS